MVIKLGERIDFKDLSHPRPLMAAYRAKTFVAGEKQDG